MQKDIDTIDELLIHLSNRNTAISKQSHDYGNGEQLHAAEIHLIEHVHNHRDSSAAEIARQIGVTRVAVSTMAKKLELKGYVKKFQSPHNRKEVFYELTPSGIAAYEGHKAFHERQNRALYRKMEKFTKSQSAFLIGFLTEYIEYLEDYYNNKQK